MDFTEEECKLRREKKNRQKKEGEILNPLHEDEAGLKTLTRTGIWKCDRDCFQNYCVTN